MNSVTIRRMVAWGQYLHWAHMQFQRFVQLPDSVDVATRIGAVSHWLAAEYIVLEGWREIGLKGRRVCQLLALYPELQETLRRCRNAVYHFQVDSLDDRILKCLQNDNEELTWATALHEEFQRMLAIYPYLKTGSFTEQAELADELAACIGWFPEETLTASQIRILRKTLEWSEIVASDQSEHRQEARRMIANTSEEILAMKSDQHLTSLKRWTSNE